MGSFKTFIAESRMTTHDEVVKAISGYKKAGEILNPAYQDLVDQAKRIMRGGQGLGHKPDGIFDAMRSNRDDQDLSDLYYTSFDSFASHNKIQKLNNKLKKKNNPAFKTVTRDVDEYLAKWKKVGEDLKDLKGKVVKVTQKRAEAKAAAETTMAKKFSDSSSLIKIFESHLDEYKKRAEYSAREFVKHQLEILKKNGWDLDKVAPRSNSYHDYKTAQQKRQMYQMLTKARDSNPRRGEPFIVDPDKVRIEHYVKLNVQGAEDAYRSFMAKMIQKIGKPVKDAVMTGNIWTNATLTVTTDDNEQQVWNTKMIINFSKYNKMFNQFPSRRKK